MSALRSRGGQTALEMLFIMAVIFMGGVVVILPSYMQNNSEVSVLAGIRSVASDVASYVSVGVIAENRTEFDCLNDNITAYYDYLSGRFVFEGLKVQNETEDSMTVLVKFKTLGESNSTVDKELVGAVGEAMVESLKEIRGGFGERDGKLYYGGIEVVLNVSVNDEWGEFP
ncbi:hypothetical protein [Thermococcus sp. JCM 11816]|uniref:hypothetical protein n=1 Tax=Thermococcus sp. (strain JCM 11816 / KS-1) TaxID=1295125 RepID=UPI000AC7FB10